MQEDQIKTSQELRMLSSVTLDCQETKFVMNSGSQIVRIVISVSIVTSLQDCFKNCQICQISQMSQMFQMPQMSQVSQVSQISHTG